MLERIAHYELQEPLGSGALGTTYRAREMRTGSAVALKVVTPEIAADEEVAARLQHEARIASALHHPNIATVTDHGEDGGTVYVASELVEGESLRTRLRRDGRLSEAETLRIALSVAHALIAADFQRVVHRNLRPENILLGQAGHVAVCDFGLTQARDVSLPTSLKPWIADPVYAAPEVSEGRAHSRSDLYSLGAIMYEVLTGRPPDRSATQEGNGISASDLAALRRCSQALAPIVRRLLQSQAARRYGSADELLGALMSVGRVESTLISDDAPSRREGFGGVTRVAGAPLAIAGLALGAFAWCGRAAAGGLGRLGAACGRFVRAGGGWLMRGVAATAIAPVRGARGVGHAIGRGGSAALAGVRGLRRGASPSADSLLSAADGTPPAGSKLPNWKIAAGGGAIAVALAGGGFFAVSAMGGDDGGRHEGAVLGVAVTASATSTPASSQPRSTATKPASSGVVGSGDATTETADVPETSATPEAVSGSGVGGLSGPRPATVVPNPTATSRPAVAPPVAPTWTPVPPPPTIPPTARPTEVASSTPRPSSTPLPPTATPTPGPVTVAFVSDTSWTAYDDFELSDEVGQARIVCLRRMPTAIPASCPASALAWRDWDDDPNPWTAQLGTAQWIWAPGVTGNSLGANNANYFIARCFNLPGTPISGSLQVAVDWGADLYVNGEWVVWAESDAQAATVDIGSYLESGDNCISFEVYNEDPCSSPCTYADNPAGLLVRGSVTYRAN